MTQISFRFGLLSLRFFDLNLETNFAKLWLMANERMGRKFDLGGRQRLTGGDDAILDTSSEKVVPVVRECEGRTAGCTHTHVS